MLIDTYKSLQWENITPFFYLKYLSSLGPHCQSQGADQDMGQTWLYLCYPLYETQWHLFDQQIHQT